MSIKGIKVRQAEFITLLSILSGSSNMNENSLENCEVSVASECLKRNSHTNSFSFSETSE